MTWQRRQRVERAVAQALKPGARPPLEMLCELAGGCAPDGEMLSRRSPRLVQPLAAAMDAVHVPAITLGACARCGELVAHDGERLLRGE